MSHFSCIKTKLHDQEHIVEALKSLQYDTVQEQQVMVVADVEHAKGHPDVPVDFTSVNGKVGFKWNQEEECFEMVVDEQTWDLNVPVEMFIKKLTQQYALTSVVSAVKQEGFQIAEQYVNPVDQAVELVCTRWE